MQHLPIRTSSVYSGLIHTFGTKKQVTMISPKSKPEHKWLCRILLSACGRLGEECDEWKHATQINEKPIFLLQLCWIHITPFYCRTSTDLAFYMSSMEKRREANQKVSKWEPSRCPKAMVLRFLSSDSNVKVSWEEWLTYCKLSNTTQKVFTKSSMVQQFSHAIFPRTWKEGERVITSHC